MRNSSIGGCCDLLRGYYSNVNGGLFGSFSTFDFIAPNSYLYQ